MKHEYKMGLVFAFLAAIISGVSIFYNKVVVISGMDATIFNSIKNGSVGLILTAVLLSTKKIQRVPSLSSRNKLLLMAVAAIGGSIPFILFFEGLKIVPATNAAIIQKSLFLWVSILAVPLVKEKIRSTTVIAFALIAWCNLFLGGFPGFSFSLGEGLILSATLLWAMEAILIKRIAEHTDSRIIAWSRMMGGAVVLLLIAVSLGKFPLFLQIQPTMFFPLLGSILLLTVYVTSWTAAIKRLPVTLVMAILVLSTPITNILSAVFISHSLPQAAVINIVGTIIAISLILLVETKTQKTHDKSITEQPIQPSI
jgi:drug/metabolite transporter (DMT)-like permease